MSTSTPNNPGTTTKPSGLVSFMYHAFYDPATTDQLQKDPQGTMIAFGITPDNPCFKVCINMQDAGSAAGSLDPTVFAECIQYIQTTYANDPKLQQKLNALIIGQGTCQEVAQDYDIVW